MMFQVTLGVICFSLFIAVRSLTVSGKEEWALEVKSSTTIEYVNALAEKHMFTNYGKIGNLENTYRFVRHGTSGRTLLSSSEDTDSNIFTSDTMVVRATRQIGQQRVKRVYQEPLDTRWKDQWSLKNTGQTNGPKGLDLNVERAWLQGLTGKGVLVAVVDDGVEGTHPDLKDNYDASSSYNFADNTDDPTPDPPTSSETNSHGTNCAGEIAMINNTMCGIGVAYASKIAALKFNLGAGKETADSEESSALGHQNNDIMIYSNSWGPSDYGFVVNGPGLLLQKTFENAMESGRNGKGSIYVFASGNGGWYYDSCAADGYVNSIYTIAIGSADQNGNQASYDENCTAKIAVTYSFNSDTFPTDPDDDWTEYNQITTLDLNGGCTDTFTGTSSSAPLASGTIALTLEANPSLTWRDIQYLLVYTSDPTSLSGGDWITNGAGLRVSPQFGFGAIDAEAMVTRARHWTNVPNQLHTKHHLIYSDSFGNVPSQSVHTANLEVSINSTNIRFLEHVIVTMSLKVSLSGTYQQYYDYDSLPSNYDIKKDIGSVDFESDIVPDQYDTDSAPANILRSKRDSIYSFLTDDHARRGDIMVELLSPNGTKSVLLPYRKYDFINAEGYESWPFMSLHHWGENPIGTWSIVITYKNSHASVDFIVHNVQLYGTSEVPQSVSRIPQSCDPACDRGCAAYGQQYCDSCKTLRDIDSLNCINKCPQNLTEYNGYCGEIELASTSGSGILIPLSISGGVVSVLCVLIITVSLVCIHLKYKKHKNRRTRFLVSVDEID